MKTALIFLHGDLTCISHIPPQVKSADLIIGADGGAEYAVQAGLTPHIVIGDLDSISPRTKHFLEHKTQWQVYPRQKDHTDAELAIHYALKEKVDHIYIAGFLGRRIDHMLSSLHYLSTLTTNISLFEGAQILTFIKKKAVIKGKKDEEISLIPLQEDCLGVTTQGLVYPLHKETLSYGATRGVSNVMIAEQATIELTSGTLLCIHNLRIS